MTNCRDNKELLIEVEETINKINKDIGTECIKFTTIDTNFLNELALNSENLVFKDGNWVEVDKFKELNKNYTEFLMKNFFNNDSQRYNIMNYHVRSIEYNAETYFSIGSKNYHRDFQNPYIDKFAAHGTWNVIAYQNLKNCNFKNAGTGLVYLQNRIDSSGRKIKLCQNIVLPAFEGLVLAIKDNCFYHYTPNVIINPGENVKRTLIRNYVIDTNINASGYELDHDELQYLCTQGRNIERLNSRDNLDPVPLIQPRRDIPENMTGGYKDFNY